MRNRDNRLTTAQITAFKNHLRNEEREQSTIEKYLHNIRAFAAWLDGAPVTKSAVIVWKEHLLSERYAPATVNAALAALNAIFIDFRQEDIQICQTLLSFGKLALVIPDGLFLILSPAAKPFLLESVHILTDILRHGPDALQYHVSQYFLPDVVGRTGAAPAFIVGADIAVLVSLEALTGAETELTAAVGTEQQTGEQALPFPLGETTLILSKLLHPVPLSLRHNGLLGIRQDEHILSGIGDALLELIGLGIGLKIAGTASIFHSSQNLDDRLFAPMVGALRQRFSFLLGIQSLDRQYPVSLKDVGNPGRANTFNRHVEDTLDDWSGFFIWNPVVLVLRVGAIAVGRFAQVLAAGPLDLHYGTDLLAGVFGVKIIKNIADHGKIIVSLGAVHGIVHRDKTHVVAGENDFRISSDLQVISAKSGHVFDNPYADQALFHQRKSFLDAGTIEIRPGVPVIHQDTGISEAMICGIAGKNKFLETIVLRIGIVSLTCSAVLLPLLLFARWLHNRYAARTCYFL